ncbi:linear amide C-N hydrolase [Romboutsia hominis]|uniref:linear amide C-N hydrolase n=1 Tax=Romboutsia hominis TaxID=1507512 RepID=UPI002ED3E265
MNKMKYAILGMVTTIDNHPLLNYVLNEKRLTYAELNFLEYAYYEKKSLESKLNLGPWSVALLLHLKVNMFKENLDADTLKSFTYINKPVIHFAS